MASIKEKIKLFYIKQLDFIKNKIIFFRENQIKSKLGYCAHDVVLKYPVLTSFEKTLASIYLYEGTWIYEQSKFIMDGGKFIMKKNSGAAQGLTVITVNHPSEIGKFFKDIVKDRVGHDKDVVVEEDVWIGANVTLLAGVRIGRGAVIGAGAVCRTKVPPYAIVLGNPARVAGFRFRPDGIIEHEKALYPENERIHQDILEKNYRKFFENQNE